MSEEENANERRKAPRYKAEGEVCLSLEGHDDVKLVGQLADISRIGVFVLLDYVDEDWSYKMFNLHIKTKVYDEELEIRGRSVIVRTVPQKGVGVHINEIFEEYRRSFVKFIGYVQQPENAV